MLTEIADELLGVVVDQPALLDGLLNGGEVRICEHHVRRELGDVRATAHSDTDVGLLQSRRVVDTITSHRDDQAEALKQVDELALVPGLGTAE